MKGVAICLRGVEKVCATEIKEIIKCTSKINDTAIVFDIKSQKDLAKFCYKAQSPVKVLYLLDVIKVDNDLNNTLDELEKHIKKIDFGDWFKDRTFKVRCKRIGNQVYSTQDLAALIGEYIIDNTKAKVSMKDPDITIYAYIYNDKCYLGIDFSGFDLSKRDFKVFTHPTSLNSTLAYSLLRIGGYKKGTILDSFCGAGSIPIEAALYINNKSPHFFKKDKFAFHHFLDIDLEKFDTKPKTGKKKIDVIGSDHLLKFVKSSKTNAKLAGIEKQMNITRMDLEWLDTKLDEASIDLIVTNPPSESRMQDSRKIKKIYKEFFYQAKYILKKTGKIVFCVQKDKIAKLVLENFKITDDFSVWQGKMEMKVLVLEFA
jgi:23S rRNA G2445 N2-methylase RlmL